MQYDSIIIGSGPNGLAAGIHLTRAGLKVKIFEAMEKPGGGMRTIELTLPGFKHDICSAIHPMGFASPFFRNLQLEKYGLEWVHPPVSVAHPFEDGDAVYSSVRMEDSEECLKEDYTAYKEFFLPLIEKWHLIENNILGPLRFPSHPAVLLKFGLNAVKSAQSFANKFKSPKTRAYLLGVAAHNMLPPYKITTAAVGIVLGIYAHKYGWPFPKGGTQQLADALTSCFISLGGEIEYNNYVTDINDLPTAKSYIFDTSPRQLINIAGERITASYTSEVKKFRYGPGVFKIDFALSAPIPWTSGICKKATTVHIGSTAGEITASENYVWHGKVSSTPFILLAQHSLFDNTRAPQNCHTAWAYCHVPSYFNGDISELIINRIELFAPGFKKIILSKIIHTPADYEKYNPNYIGGDINGGSQIWSQIFTRPVLSLTPYRTSSREIYICSACTPPGGGVHGMCGFHAAETVLRDIFPSVI